MSYDKVLLLTRRHYQNRTRNCGQRHFRKFWTSYLQNFDQKMTFDDSDQIEIRLPCNKSF